MPEMNGIELLRIMKKESAYSQIPVIMQTARTDKKNILAGISNGAYFYRAECAGNVHRFSIQGVDVLQRFNNLLRCFYLKK